MAQRPTATFRYGKIPGYRDPSRKSWGFEIDQPDATDMRYGQYTCPRRLARRLWERLLRPNAEHRGYQPVLIVDDGCGLDQELRPLPATEND